MRPLRAPLDMEAGRSVGLPALLIALGVVLFLMMPAAASQDKENRVIAVNQIMRSAGPNIVPTMSAEDRLAATGLPPQALPTIDRSTGQTVYIFDKKPPGNYTIVLPYTFASGGVFNSAADVVLRPDQRVLSADGNIDVKNNFTSDYLDHCYRLLCQVFSDSFDGVVDRAWAAFARQCQGIGQEHQKGRFCALSSYLS